MSERRARELPKIDIGGTMFYLDVRLNEFRQVENFMNRINLDDLWDTGKEYLLAFDTSTKSLFMGDGEEYHLRKGKDVLEIKLPRLSEMDPEGMKWLTQEWVENNPIINMIGFVGVDPTKEKHVLVSDKILPKKKSELLVKNRHRSRKGKRL